MSDVIEYKCPSCNASMVFDSKSQHMKCPYCDTEMTVEEFQRTQKSEDTQTTGKSISNDNWYSMSTGQWQNDELNGMRVYSCQSCGSEIVAEETTGATTCPFCNNKITMKGQFSGDLKPDYIIPFKLDKKAAKENYYKHLKGKKYLPKVFKKENHVDEIKGVYIPFWLFDVDADAQITYEAEKVHSHTSGDTEYTTREIYSVYREGSISFDHVPADGSRKIDDTLMEAIEPYKVSKENVQIAEKSEDEDVPFVEGIKILFKNKYWVIMLVLQFLMNISYSLSMSGGTYYAKYILGNDNIVALLGAVGLIPTLLGFILTGPMASKLGMTKTCMVSCAMGAAACLVRVFTPYSIATCIVGGAVITFANIPMMCLFGPMVNNCVEYNDYKFGKRIVGMTNSANSFGMKIGSGIGASLIGWLLAAAGYKASLAVQPGSVNIAIFAFSIYIPLALFVIMFIFLMKNDLEKRYPEIMAELQKREKAN